MTASDRMQMDDLHEHPDSCATTTLFIPTIGESAPINKFYSTPDSLSLYFASTEFLEDGLSLIRNLLDWTDTERKKLYFTLAVTAGVVAFDPWTHRAHGLTRYVQERSGLNVLATPGNGTLYLPLAAILWWHAQVHGDAKQARMGVGLASSVIWTRLLIQIPKYAFQRERPADEGDNAYAFHGPLGSYRHNAFPSGHTATAFAAAAYLRGVRPFNKSWPGQAATVLAAGTAIQRLRSGEHWLGDVVAGALFGQACGGFLARRVSGLQMSASPSGARIIIPIGQQHP